MLTDYLAELLNLGEYYDQIFGFLTPIFDFFTRFINSIVGPGFDLLLSFFLGMGI